jgi:type IV pilus assembly protein PilC
MGVVAVAVTVVLVVVSAVFMSGLWFFGLILLVVMAAFYCWTLTAYFHYRYGRQDELLHLLSTAADLNAPLAPTLWAYLRDRPQGGEREFWVAFLLFFVVPGYYWMWHRQHSFDHKIAQIALQLESGVPLAYALRATPGAASTETGLAASVGQATGQLALCLRRAARGRRTTAWLEAMYRLVAYPLALLIILSGIATFWMYFIVPKFQKIFVDFKVRLPAVTEQVMAVGAFVLHYSIELVLAAIGVVGVILLMCFSSGARWFCPGVGRLYRMNVRSRVIKALGSLLEAGMSAPQALAILDESEYFSGTVRRRLQSARVFVEQGGPLAEGLFRAGLLSRSMLPLIQASERSQRLPWALGELGDHLSVRLARLVQRISLILSPVIVIAIGVLIGLMVLGMFVPLVKLIEAVSQ